MLQLTIAAFFINANTEPRAKTYREDVGDINVFAESIYNIYNIYIYIKYITYI